MQLKSETALYFAHYIPNYFSNEDVSYPEQVIVLYRYLYPKLCEYTDSLDYGKDIDLYNFIFLFCFDQVGFESLKTIKLTNETFKPYLKLLSQEISLNRLNISDYSTSKLINSEFVELLNCVLIQDLNNLIWKPMDHPLDLHIKFNHLLDWYVNSEFSIKFLDELVKSKFTFPSLTNARMHFTKNYLVEHRLDPHKLDIHKNGDHDSIRVDMYENFKNVYFWRNNPGQQKVMKLFSSNKAHSRWFEQQREQNKFSKFILEAPPSL